jgi:hypothetical protein
MQHFENKENLDIQKLQDQLEKQYGPAVAQDIVDRLQKTVKIAKTPDYMDVKAMSELQEKFRAQAMMAIWHLKEWRRGHHKNPLQKNLIQLEGVFLQRQCEDAIKLYRRTHKSYFTMHREAMESLTAAPAQIHYAAGQRA